MQLHAQVIGEGTPFVILHGFLGMSDNWKTLGNEFSEAGYQVHLVDQRNHGRSFHSETFGYKAMAEDLKAYCDTHQLDEIILMGHSMGGIVARAMALLPGFDDTTVSCHDFIIDRRCVSLLCSLLL